MDILYLSNPSFEPRKYPLSREQLGRFLDSCVQCERAGCPLNQNSESGIQFGALVSRPALVRVSCGVSECGTRWGTTIVGGVLEPMGASTMVEFSHADKKVRWLRVNVAMYTLVMTKVRDQFGAISRRVDIFAPADLCGHFAQVLSLEKSSPLRETLLLEAMRIFFDASQCGRAGQGLSTQACFGLRGSEMLH